MEVQFANLIWFSHGEGARILGKGNSNKSFPSNHSMRQKEPTRGGGVCVFEEAQLRHKGRTGRANYLERLFCRESETAVCKCAKICCGHHSNMQGSLPSTKSKKPKFRSLDLWCRDFVWCPSLRPWQNICSKSLPLQVYCLKLRTELQSFVYSSLHNRRVLLYLGLWGGSKYLNYLSLAELILLSIQNHIF